MALPLRAAALAAASALAVVCPSASASTAPIVTLAGNGQAAPYPGSSGVAATSVPFRSAGDVAPSGIGNGVVFADPADNRVLQLGGSGTIDVLAGNGTAGYTGDDMTLVPSDAAFRGPTSVAPYNDQSFQTGFVIADGTNECMRFAQYGLDPAYMRRDAGTCDPNTALQDATHFTHPQAVAAVPGTMGSYYVADSMRVIKVTSGTMSVLSSSATVTYPPTDGAALSSSYVGLLHDVATTPTDGDYYLATTQYDDGTNGRILHVTTNGTLHIAAGGGSALGDGGAATSASLLDPTSVIALADGGYLIYDGGHARIRRVSAGGTISTLAGTGVSGASADGTPADRAQIATQGHLALTNRGLVFTQTAGGAGRVREVPATSILSGPAANTKDTHAAFTFGSWDSAATFACARDGNAASGCGPFTVGEGVHHLVVNATTDGTRTDTSNVTWTWRVDTTPPASFESSSPDEGATVAPKPTFTWQQTSDSGSGIDHYELWIDGAQADQTTACCSIDPVLSDGQHTWQVKAVDKAGNVASSPARTFTVSDPPIASLVVAPNPALAGRTVTFDASKSTDGNGSVVDYQWDLDGNGSFETDTGATPRATHSYDKPQTVAVAVQVTDNDGSTGQAKATLTISSLPPRAKQLGVSINDGAQYTNDPDVTVFAVWPGFASDMLISNDGGFKRAEDFPVAEKAAWKLDSSGPERLPKTIYVRFLGGTQTSETYQDDIILDQTPPKVQQAAVAAAAAATAARAAVTRAWKVKLKATDSNSGVRGVQITANKHKPGKLIAYKKKLTVRSAKRPSFVRAKDRAGNFSPWRRAAKR